MQEAILHLNEVGNKKKDINETIPTINRADIMEGILSTALNTSERSLLSNLYSEITYMEKKDLKYINKIAVSCQKDLEIYEILKKVIKKKKA